ncbi:MAG: hypothetical protein ACRCWQ_01530 [Bacilli bacterium]
MKQKLQDIKNLRNEIAKTQAKMIDIQETIGILKVVESSGMPRCSMSEHTSDTHRKLESKLEEGKRLEKLWVDYANYVIEVDELIEHSNLSVDEALAFREYYLRVRFCNKLKRYKSKSMIEVANELHVTAPRVHQLLEIAYKKIELNRI